MSDSIPQLGDPFSAAASQDTAPGFLGQSPGFWNHLAMFGGNLAAAANARTPSGHLAYGAGFAGPFGAAIGETAQQAQGQALNQARVGSLGAETRKQNLENQSLSYQLPLQQAQAETLAGYWKDPTFLKNLVAAAQGQQGGGTPNYFGGQAQAPAAGGSYAGTVDGPLEGGPGQNPRSSASGYGQLIDTNKQKFVAARPDLFKGMTSPEQINAAFQNPAVGEAATNWLAGQNAPVLQQAGVAPTGPNLAMAHRLGAGAAAAVAKAPDDMPLTSALVQSIGLPQTRAYVDANPGMAAQTVGGFKQQFAHVPDPFGAFAQSAQLGRQAAAQQALQALHFPIAGGDPAFTRQQAQDWWKLGAAPLQAGSVANAELGPHLAQQGIQQNPDGTQSPIKGGLADPAYLASKADAEARAKAAVELQTAGPIQAQKSANSNLDMREGGLVRMVNPDGTASWIKNPKLEKFETPEGTTQYGHISPALPGSPPGTPGQMDPVLGPGGQPVMEALPKNVQDQRDKAYEEFTGKEGDSYIAAQNTHQWLEQMNHAADTLNAGGGFLSTGPYAPERLAFANTVNDMLRSAGLPNAFDANKIASWEELKKATTTAGFELSSHYEGHARQAAATIENATSAVPAAANSPIGFKTVLAGIQESAQSAIDLHEYKQSVMNDPQKFVNAGVDFYKANPPQMYADRAISTVNPFKVQTPIGMNRYLPGTYVTLPNGKLTQVPERSGAPPIPTYLQQAAPGGG